MMVEAVNYREISEKRFLHGIVIDGMFPVST